MRKIGSHFLFGCVAFTVTSFLFVNASSALEVTFPQETAVYRPSEMPGYQAVLRNCFVCHAAQYVETQPVTARPYWDATVKKMKKAFGAQFPDEDIPMMVDYLVKTYCKEAPSAAEPAAAAPPASSGR